MKHVALMAVVMLLAGVAEGQDRVEGRPADSMLHIEPLGGKPDKLWTLTDQLADSTFRCQTGYWPPSDSQTIEVTIDYC